MVPRRTFNCSPKGSGNGFNVPRYLTSFDPCRAFAHLPCLSCLLAVAKMNWVAPSKPPTKTPKNNDLGPRSPLEPGTEYWFSMNRSYKRTSESDSSGATQGEAQSVGHMCIKITEVKDTATEAYQSEAQTIIMADVQVRGSSPGSTSMDFSDQSGEANTDPQLMISRRTSGSRT